MRHGVLSADYVKLVFLGVREYVEDVGKALLQKGCLTVVEKTVFAYFDHREFPAASASASDREVQRQAAVEYEQ